MQIVKEVGGAARVTKLPWEKKPAAPKSASVASYKYYGNFLNTGQNSYPLFDKSRVFAMLT